MSATVLSGDATNHFFRALDARIKFLFVISLIFASTLTPPGSGQVFAGYFVLLAGLWIAARVPGRALRNLGWLFLPWLFMGLLMLPFAAPMRVFLMLAKTGCSLLAIFWLMETTPFPALLEGLGRLRLPRLFVTLLGFLHRYLFLIGEEFSRMRRAATLRGWRGRWFWHATALGGMVGSLFLRCYERGERVHQSMASRGFDGQTLRRPAPRPFSSPEWIGFVCGELLLASLFFWSMA